MREKSKEEKLNARYYFVLSIFLMLLIVFMYLKADKQPGIPKCPNCNVIIISPNNIRAGHLGLYGYERETSPNLDLFSKESIVFTNAFSQSSWSLPAAASLFTSQYPFTHGLMDRKILDSSKVTLAEILRLYNFTTVAFTGGGDYKSIYGIDKGFDIFDDNDNSIIFTGSFNRTAKAALDWISNNKNKKFFIFLQGYDAHCPYNQPQKYRMLFEKDYDGNLNDKQCILDIQKERNPGESGAYIQGAYIANMINSTDNLTFIPVNITLRDIEHLKSIYDSSIRYTDDLLGMFLNELKQSGVMGNTIIIFIGDHGESLGTHSAVIRYGAQKGILYDEVIHIPLVVRHPFIKNGKRIDSLAETIDIMPTILDFLGIPKNHESQGLSLLSAINGSKENLREFVFSGGQFFHRDPYYVTINDAVRSKKWKLIFERTSDNKISNLELYDLENDPDELNNIVALEPEIAIFLKERLQKWEQTVIKKHKLRVVELSKDELKAVREAGYAG